MQAEIITIYRGTDFPNEKVEVFLASAEEARRLQGRAEPIHAIKMEDGTVYLCRREPVTLVENADGVVRERAIAKLNPDERRVLGV